MAYTLSQEIFIQLDGHRLEFSVQLLQKFHVTDPLSVRSYLRGCQEVDAVQSVYDESLNEQDELVELPRQAEAERRHVHQPHQHLLRRETHIQYKHRRWFLQLHTNDISNDSCCAARAFKDGRLLSGRVGLCLVKAKHHDEDSQ